MAATKVDDAVKADDTVKTDPPEAPAAHTNGVAPPAEKVMFKTATELMQARVTPMKEVYLTASKGWIWVKGLSSAEINRMNRQVERAAKKKADGTFPAAWERDNNAIMTLYAACNEAGERLFQPVQLQWISEQMPMPDVLAIVQTSGELSGINVNRTQREEDREGFDETETVG